MRSRSFARCSPVSSSQAITEPEASRQRQRLVRGQEPAQACGVEVRVDAPANSVSYLTLLIMPIPLTSPDALRLSSRHALVTFPAAVPLASNVNSPFAFTTAVARIEDRINQGRRRKGIAPELQVAIPVESSH